MDYLMGGGGSRKNTPRFRAIVPDPDEDLEECCRGVPRGGRHGSSSDPGVPMPASSTALIQLPELLQTLLDEHGSLWAPFLLVWSSWYILRQTTPP